MIPFTLDPTLLQTLTQSQLAQLIVGPTIYDDDESPPRYPPDPRPHHPVSCAQYHNPPVTELDEAGTLSCCGETAGEQEAEWSGRRREMAAGMLFEVLGRWEREGWPGR